MSLLNDMLEDLARRERPPAGIGDASAESFVPRPRRWPGPLAALLAGLCLGSTGWYLAGIGSGVPALPSVSSAPPSEAAEPGTAGPAVAEDAPGAIPADVPSTHEIVATPPVPAPRSTARPARKSRARLAREAAEEGRELAAVGRLPAAEASWERALRLDPTRNEIRVDASRALAAAGQDEKALAWLRRARAEQPGRSDLAVLEAELLIRAGRTDDALRGLQQTGPEIRAAATIAGLEAALLQLEGRHEEAAEAYERALDRAPESARYWLGLAVSAEALGRVTEARTAFARALEHPGLDSEPRAYVRERLEALVEEGP